MSRNQGAENPQSQTKSLGNTGREISNRPQKAKTYYPAEDERIPKKVRLNPSIDLPIINNVGKPGEMKNLQQHMRTKLFLGS